MLASLPIISCTDESGTPNCGACCQRAGQPPYTMRELTMLPADIRDRMLAMVMEGTRDNQPCLALSGRACSVYEHRPAICRSFDVGMPYCIDSRKREGIDA